MNQTDQISFTAIHDGSMGYQLLENENYILFDKQLYRIKQADKDDSGYDYHREITATHIRFDAQYIYQYEKHKGEWTVGPADLMSFVFDQNELGNKNFTWTIIGEPPKVKVQDYGEKSGQDCINDCCEKFNMVVSADNRHIFLTTMDIFTKKVDVSFKYVYNTPEFKTSIDTTELQNITKCYGKTKDKDKDEEDDDSEPEYYFPPFIVRDEESIKIWGERPGPAIHDERFTDPEAMRKYALATMKSEPDVQMTLSYTGNDSLALGNMVYAIIRPENFETWVTVTAIKTNVLAWYSNPEITLNNTPQNLIDYELAIQKTIQAVSGRLSNIGKSLSAVDTLANNAWGMGTITKKVGEVND
ncbi:MAG: phage tail protein [Lactobacillus sp.]|nr:phage tail protein [Lactobacillus sp.]